MVMVAKTIIMTQDKIQSKCSITFPFQISVSFEMPDNNPLFPSLFPEQWGWNEVSVV